MTTQTIVLPSFAQGAAGVVPGPSSAAAVAAYYLGGDAQFHTVAGSIPTPTAGTLGGVFSASAPANQFMTGVNTSGAPTFAQPTVNNLANYTSPITGAVARSAFGKLTESISLGDFGALVGDGVTDNSSAVTAAEAVAGRKYVQGGLFKLNSFATMAALNGPYFGDGQLKTNDGNKVSKYFAQIAAAPGSFGNESSILTAFNGDDSKQQFSVGHMITGVATLGQPVSGYLYTPEAYPFYVWLYNSSGWNQSTSSNVGRTAACAFRTNVYQNGQGDAVAYNANVFVTGAKVGATSFLANPNGTIINGQIIAGQAGVFLNGSEFDLIDNGVDAAGVGFNINLNRSITTGALSAWWAGYRTQSIGSGNCDVAFSANGKWNYGLDLSQATFAGSPGQAISLAHDQGIYFNATADGTGLGRFPASAGTTYINYNNASSFLNFVVGNASCMQLSSGGLVTPQVVNTTQNYRVSGTQVVGAQITGYGSPTGNVKTASYAAYAGQTWGASYSQTVGQNLDNAVVTLSKQVAQIIVDLKTHGLLGA